MNESHMMKIDGNDRAITVEIIREEEHQGLHFLGDLRLATDLDHLCSNGEGARSTTRALAIGGHRERELKTGEGNHPIDIILFF